MIAIELMIQPEDNSEASGKVWKFQVPAMPRKGNLFKLWDGRELSTHVVSDVCFEERGREPCAVIVFVKQRVAG